MNCTIPSFTINYNTDLNSNTSTERVFGILNKLSIDDNHLEEGREVFKRFFDYLLPIMLPERALKLTYLEAKQLNCELIGTEHLLLAILKDENNIVTKSFQKKGIDYDEIKNELSLYSKVDKPEKIKKNVPKNSISDSADEDVREGGGKFFGGGVKKTPAGKSKTPVLDNFGRDLTRSA